MSERRRVCVVTTSRADYGLLRFLISDLGKLENVALQVVVSGAHLLASHGLTVSEIEADGVRITERIESQLANDSPVSAAKSLGLATIGFAECFSRLNPDVVVLLGDRYELLAPAQAALLATIPVAHIHGGEVTRGAFDDATRHALTKLSHLHFVGTPEFAHRVEQLGESPERVHVVGALGIDALRRLALPRLDELAEQVELDLSKRFALLTYHPETLGLRRPEEAIREVLAALDRSPEITVLATSPNVDPGSRAVRAALEHWCASRPRTRLVHSLGQTRYLTALKHAAFVIGNSSSGIIEAPSAGALTINVGERQEGRPRAASVIDVQAREDEVSQAIQATIARDSKRVSRTPFSNPYDRGDAAGAIAQILLSTDLPTLVKKRFIDWPMGR